MALKIRMKRMGKKNTPFYRMVIQDSRWRRDGKTIEDLGWYDPVKQPAQISIKEERVFYWIDNGAQVSETVRSILKKQGLWDKFRSKEYKETLKQAQEKAQQKAQPVTPSAFAPASAPAESNPVSE